MKMMKRIPNAPKGKEYLALQDAKGFRRMASFESPGESVEYRGATYKRTARLVTYVGNKKVRLYVED